MKTPNPLFLFALQPANMDFRKVQRVNYAFFQPDPVSLQLLPIWSVFLIFTH